MLTSPTPVDQPTTSSYMVREDSSPYTQLFTDLPTLGSDLERFVSDLDPYLLRGTEKPSPSFPALLVTSGAISTTTITLSSAISPDTVSSSISGTISLPATQPRPSPTFASPEDSPSAASTLDTNILLLASHSLSLLNLLLEYFPTPTDSIPTQDELSFRMSLARTPVWPSLWALDFLHMPFPELASHLSELYQDLVAFHNPSSSSLHPSSNTIRRSTISSLTQHLLWHSTRLQNILLHSGNLTATSKADRTFRNRVSQTRLWPAPEADLDFHFIPLALLLTYLQCIYLTFNNDFPTPPSSPRAKRHSQEH